MTDNRRKDASWIVPDADGRITSWDQCILAVLMDIRDELKAANRVWGCHNFQRIPQILDAIAEDARRRNRQAKERAKRKRAATLRARPAA